MSRVIFLMQKQSLQRPFEMFKLNWNSAATFCGGYYSVIYHLQLRLVSFRHNELQEAAYIFKYSRNCFLRPTNLLTFTTVTSFFAAKRWPPKLGSTVHWCSKCFRWTWSTSEEYFKHLFLQWMCLVPPIQIYCDITTIGVNITYGCLATRSDIYPNVFVYF